MSTSLYDQDFYAWTSQQAALLRSGSLSLADIEHIAEEIESMGRSERRELVSRLRVLLHHLLKWQYQPSRRGQSWRLSVLNARDELESLLRDNPSLKAILPAGIVDAYRLARRDAALETELPENTFPVDCPWPYDRAVDENFWPGEPDSWSALE